MDLGPNEEQRHLIDVVGALFRKHSTPAVVRAAEPLGFDGELWTQVVDAGLTSLPVAEAFGGSSGSAVDASLVAEVAGAALAPVPLVDGWVALRAIERCASAGADVLERLAAEGTPVAYALHEAQDGTFPMVPSGAVARAVVGLDAGELVLVTGPPSPPIGNLGRLPLAHRSAREPDRVILAAGSDAIEVQRLAVAEWKAFTSMALVGLAGAAIDLAVAYAGEREQFGVPIGSFQALAHQLADVTTGHAGARLIALKAAWAIDEDPGDVDRITSMAFCHCVEVARAAAETCVHVHGGMGFSNEGDAQLYFRRAAGWPQVYRGVERELEHLGRVLYGRAEA